MLLLVAVLLLSTVEGQSVNSFAGPFDLELQRVEACPSAISGLNLYNITRGLTQDKKYPTRFYAAGVINHSFNIMPSVAVIVRVSSWNRGRWKENVYHHTVPRACEEFKARAEDPASKRLLRSALGPDFSVTCPFPASRWEFTGFPVDTSGSSDFVYGKWRIDVQMVDGSTVLSCYRQFVDTVPKVPGRQAPQSEGNYTNTVRISRIKSLYP